MKYYLFYRENDNFDDILSDKVVKKFIDTTIRWRNHLRIGVAKSVSSKIDIHITLKYGDELRNTLTEDYSPKPYIDYIPRKPE
jgi:hypothetical protein